MTSKDELLIRQMKQGQATAFEQCYRQYAPSVFTAISNIAQCHATADDVLQDTFISAFAAISTIESDYCLIAWLKRIAFNKFYNVLRQQKRSVQMGQQLLSVSEHLNRDMTQTIEQSNLLSVLFTKVREKERLVLWMYIVEQYSHSEIAELFAKTPSFSKSIVSRSLNSLKQYSQELSDVG